MDLLTAPRPELIRIIHEQNDRISALETQNAELKEEINQLKELIRQKDSSQKKLLFKAKTPEQVKKLPKARDHGYSRKLDSPTHKIFHTLDTCNECGGSLGKPTVSYTRQIIDLPKVKVVVTEHVVFKRWCGNCRKQVSPEVNFSSQVLGKHRVGIRLMATIALLRDRCRLPIRVIQSYLKLFYSLNLSRGEVLKILHTVAKASKPTYDNLLEQIRSSPVIHADETGGREDGKNGYFWSFSSPKVHFVLYRKSRSAAVVEEVLGTQVQMEKMTAVLVTDFYASYNIYTGFHQRCWVHLLRDIDELLEQNPLDDSLKVWASSVYEIYHQALSYPGPDTNLPTGLKMQERIKTQHQFEQELLQLSSGYVKTSSPQSTLCARIVTFLSELFTFVRFPDTPSHNNNAERIIRHLVIQRKISGGTRSEKGSETKSILTSIFDTWKLQNKNPLLQCQLLLANYH